MQPFDREKLARHNILFMVLEGTIFWAGMAFIEGNTVISVFVKSQTGSVALAGLAAAVRSGIFLVGQVFMGMFIHKLPSQSRFMTIVSFCSRPILLLMTPILLSGVSGPPAAWLLILFIGLFFLSDGFVGLIWMEILGRTIPIEKRGQVIGLQQVFGGGVGIIAGIIIRFVLGSALSVNTQFAILFGLAGGLLLIDSFAIWMIHDVPQEKPAPSPPINPLRYFKQFIPLWKNVPKFHTVIYMRIIYLVGLCAAPLIVLFAQTLIELSPDQLTILIFLQISGNVAGGFLFGMISRWYGYRSVMIISQIVNLIVPSMAFAALFLSPAAIALVPVGIMIFLSSFNNSAWLGYTNHMLTVVPTGSSALYIVLQGILSFPVSLLSYAVGGIAQAFGFIPVFVTTFIAGFCGFVLTNRAYGKKA